MKPHEPSAETGNGPLRKNSDEAWKANCVRDSHGEWVQKASLWSAWQPCEVSSPRGHCKMWFDNLMLHCFAIQFPGDLPAAL